MASGVTLLVAEDEPLILLGLQDALEEGGYLVLTASNGNEALVLLECQHHNLVGLITDIRIGPGPSGWEVALRARELQPELAVVYVSGDSVRDWPSKGLPRSIAIEKPFADAQLVTAISTLINEAGKH